MSCENYRTLLESFKETHQELTNCPLKQYIKGIKQLVEKQG